MWRRIYQPPPQNKSEEDLDHAESTILFYPLSTRLARAPDLIALRLVALNNRTKTFLHFGLVITAVSTALDSFPSTYINFDLLYRLGAKMNSQFPQIQGRPRALARVSATEPDRVYP